MLKHLRTIRLILFNNGRFGVSQYLKRRMGEKKGWNPLFLGSSILTVIYIYL